MLPFELSVGSTQALRLELGGAGGERGADHPSGGGLRRGAGAAAASEVNRTEGAEGLLSERAEMIHYQYDLRGVAFASQDVSGLGSVLAIRRD